MLVNITGGEDLTLGEVNQISEVIHDAAGDQAEIIFGAVTEPAMEGEVRVTVIATGFDQSLSIQESPFARSAAPGVLPFPQRPTTRPSTPIAMKSASVPEPAHPEGGPEVEIAEMEIPTFIRRQMD